MKRALIITLTLLCWLPLAQSQPLDRDAIYDNIDAYARKVRKDWNIPGFALAVVKDGEVVLAKGYGDKERGKPGAVDANTVFQIGSVSKSFTAALMSMMVDEGKVRWEDKVKDVLPEFELLDKDIEAEVEVRDLMTHKLGFRSQVGTYFPNAGYDRDDVMKMMSLVEPQYGLRQGITYN
ncbi:MAG: beta-lactamase family protein, partial [Bacteroidales bacterium]|nr:beta-lactamase family protein [Bacteroidales bacterium]